MTHDEPFTQINRYVSAHKGKTYSLYGRENETDGWKEDKKSINKCAAENETGDTVRRTNKCAVQQQMLI